MGTKCYEILVNMVCTYVTYIRISLSQSGHVIGIGEWRNDCYESHVGGEKIHYQISQGKERSHLESWPFLRCHPEGTAKCM